MADREIWLEMDIYWFDREENTPKRYFDRVETVFLKNPQARKGVSLCVGWLRDSVLYFHGDMKEEIPTCQAPTYKYWDYQRLKDCVDSLKAEAQKRSISDFHVVIQFIGGETMYYEAEKTCEGWCGRTEELEQRANYNIRGKWFAEHPEIDRIQYGVPYLGSAVHTEVGDVKFYEYFAQKLISMTAACDLDGAVFRDHFFTPSYIRGNRNRFMSARAIRENTETFLSFFGLIKKMNPNFITIGYNSGSSPVEELRSHGFDLERICESGFLDVFIVQTWASAWQDYWPAHSMGFTFQLQYVLATLAFVKKSKCNVLFVIETFDAWEPWDSIHQYRSKVQWEIWAYSHAELKTPEGSIRCAGCYISWMNHGYDLIDRESIDCIADFLEYCNKSIQKNPTNRGCCIVYDRTATIDLINSSGLESYSNGEEFDDWCALVQKYGASIFSITRAEWLKDIDADFLIVPPQSSDAAIMKKIDKGVPVLFMGRATLIPQGIQDRFKLKVTSPKVSEKAQNVVYFDKDFSDLVNAEGCKSTIRVHTMLQSEKIKSKIWKEKYAVFSKAYDADVYFWETPEWGTKYDLHLFPNSFGDPEPFYCIAEEIRKVFSRRGLPVLAQEDYRRPVNFLWVSYAAAGNAAMAANLETGLTGNSQFAVHAQLKGAVQNVAEGFIAPTILRQDPDGVFIALAGHKAGIVTFEKQETKREGRQTGYGRPNGKKSSKAFRASANDQSRIDENV